MYIRQPWTSSWTRSQGPTFTSWMAREQIPAYECQGEKPTYFILLLFYNRTCTKFNDKTKKIPELKALYRSCQENASFWTNGWAIIRNRPTATLGLPKRG